MVVEEVVSGHVNGHVVMHGTVVVVWLCVVDV